MGKLNSLLYREGDLEGLDITVPPSRILFGSDKFCDILSGLDGLGIEHPIIVSTQGGRQRLKKLFPGLDLPYFDGVLPHGPEAVVEAFHNIYLSVGMTPSLRLAAAQFWVWAKSCLLRSRLGLLQFQLHCQVLR